MHGNEVKSILFVCLGNICRSPLAEGVFGQVLRERGLSLKLDSAGTRAWHVGSPPDPRSIEVARRFGIDIGAQRARRIAPEDFDDFDLILAMDETNLAELRALAPENKRIHLFLGYATGRAEEVPDPYYGVDGGFTAVYHMIRDASDMLVEKLALRASAPISGQASSIT
jgi:protein-tyrosine phosphatase